MSLNSLFFLIVLYNISLMSLRSYSLTFLGSLGTGGGVGATGAGCTTGCADFTCCVTEPVENVDYYLLSFFLGSPSSFPRG